MFVLLKHICALWCDFLDFDFKMNPTIHKYGMEPTWVTEYAESKFTCVHLQLPAPKTSNRLWFLFRHSGHQCPISQRLCTVTPVAAHMQRKTQFLCDRSSISHPIIPIQKVPAVPCPCFSQRSVVSVAETLTPPTRILCNTWDEVCRH